jgi:tetratricopeptide (TPR) repeat protein
MTDAKYDVFLSHAWVDGDWPQRIADALAAVGLRVWFDAAEIDDFAGITYAVTEGLARSKTLLAYYSTAYPCRRACQVELTTAFLNAQSEGDPRRRVLVINPEEGSDHIHPIELRDAKFRATPQDEAALQQLVNSVVRHLSKLDGPLPGNQPRVAPPWHGMEPVSYLRFVGRFPEMWKIHSALHEVAAAQVTGAAGKTVALLAGLGGNGKSLLAREYGIRFGAAYPGGVFWLRAHGADDAQAAMSAERREADRNDQMRSFALDLDIPVEGKDPSEIERDLRAAIADRKEPILWIVDDLPGGLDAGVIKAWTAPGSHHTLITTRSRGYDNLASANVIQLRELEKEDAYDLLASHRKPGEAETEVAHGIISDLGYHALAVDVTGARLARSVGLQSFADFRRELRREDRDALELAAQLARDLPTGHEKSIAQTLLQSIKNLRQEGLDFLSLASVLAVDPIPKPLIQGVFARVDALTEDLAMQNTLLALAQAEDLSLCEMKDEGLPSVHTLVSRTVRFHQKASIDRIKKLRAAAVEGMTSLLSETAQDARAHRGILLYAEHARHLSSSPSSLPEADLLGWVAQYDHQRAAYASARILFSRVVEFRCREQGPEHPHTLISIGGLSVTMREWGDLVAARKMQEDLLAVTRRVQGTEHPDTLHVMINLASTLRAQGELDKALELNQETYTLLLNVLGPNHMDTLTTMDNLAGTLADSGDLRGAVRLRRQAIAGFQRLLGPDHAETLIAMFNLANMFHAQGNLVEARELHEDVLAIRRQLLGSRHPGTLASMNGLAMTLRVQGDLVGARRLQEEILPILREVLGPTHGETLTAVNNLAVTLHSQRDFAAARKLNEECFDLSRRALGPEHPSTIHSMLNLSETLRALDNVAGARSLQEEALAICRNVFGPNHPTALMAMDFLARTMRSQGNEIQALVLNQELLALRRQTLGSEHPDTMRSMLTLADALDRQGDWMSSRRLREEELAHCRHVLGPEHPDTLISANNLALKLGRHGDWIGAYQLDSQTLESRRRVLGPEHPHTLCSMNSVAIDLRKLGNPAQAAQIHRMTLDLRQRGLGPENEETLESRNNLASTLRELDELAEARKLDEGTLAIRRRVLGPNHPQTLQSMNNLATVLRSQGHLDEARKLHEETLEIRSRVLGPAHPDTLQSMSNLAWAVHIQGDFPVARRIGEEVLALRRRLLGPAHPDTIFSMNNLAATLESMGELRLSSELKEQMRDLQ